MGVSATTVGEQCVRLSQLALCLVESCLERTRIDLKQELALFDECTFLIALFQQVACDLCPDVSIHQAIERADPFMNDRNVLLLNLHDLDLGQSRGWRSQSVLVRMNGSNDQSQYEQEEGSPAQKITFG